MGVCRAHRSILWLWPILCLALTLGLFVDPGPGIAQTEAPLAGFASKADMPVEITADSLEVLQEQEVAVFRGNVEVVQGDLTLKSALLRVHYGEDGGAEGTAGAMPAGRIARLDAEGGVVFTTPEQSVRGGQAVYDVAEEQITVEGDVVLQQGANVIRGERLVVDLGTGRSQIVGAPSAGGRVRGVFAPESR
jgi:lipopolysaccharide export system protein LptA